LQFRHAESAFAAADHQALRIGLQHLPRGAGRFASHGAPDLERLAAQARRCAGRRAQCTHHICDFTSRAPPVDRLIALLDLASVGHARLRLRDRLQPAGRDLRQRLHDHAGTERRELVMQGAGIVVRGDSDARLHEHWPGIESGLHPHQRHARFPIARHQRALDRRRTAPARQQRRVDIDGPEARHREHAHREDQSVGRDDKEIRARVADAIADRRVGKR
jgi:hypothetical protein